MASKKSQFRRKRADTKIGTIEKQYGVDFAARSDKKLGNYLKEKGLPSLSKALSRAEKSIKK
ncbi:MAG: hypothetical protein KJI70_00435 [Patescibacteria group bacterium]|nr:hypothetical protein [Patescibacteria group bacterium]